VLYLCALSGGSVDVPKGLRTKENDAIRAAIAGLMRKKNLEQQEVAAHMRWDKATMSRLLTGERACSAAEFAKLARVMGVRPSKMWEIVEKYL
jgi:hypothetical protein